MRKLILISILFLGCQEIKEDINSLQIENDRQAQEIVNLQKRNEELTGQLEAAVSNLLDLIQQNSDAIDSANEEIVELLVMITKNYNEMVDSFSGLSHTIDSEIADVRQEIVALQLEVLTKLQEEIDALGIENYALQSSLDEAVASIGLDIEATNELIASVEEELSNSITTLELLTLCDDDLDEAEDFVLPPYDFHFTTDFVHYDPDYGIAYNDSIVFKDITIVRFAEEDAKISEIYFRAILDGEWFGVYGRGNYDNLDLEGLPENSRYTLNPGINEYIEDDSVLLDLGAQQSELGEETDLYVSFEFDPTNGEYTGCVPTTDDVVWYVNGAQVATGNNPTFDVGHLEGYYIITAEVGDDYLQHAVEINNSSKGKLKARVKIRRPNI